MLFQLHFSVVVHALCLYYEASINDSTMLGSESLWIDEQIEIRGVWHLEKTWKLQASSPRIVPHISTSVSFLIFLIINW